MSRIVEATQRVPASLAGARLDQAAAELFSDYSRERLKAWINAGELTVDGAKVSLLVAATPDVAQTVHSGKLDLSNAMHVMIFTMHHGTTHSQIKTVFRQNELREQNFLEMKEKGKT